MTTDLAQYTYGDLVAALRKDLLLDATTDVLPGTVRAAYGSLTVVQREIQLPGLTGVTLGVIDTFTFPVLNPVGAFVAFAGAASCFAPVAGAKVRLVVDPTGAGAVAANVTPSFFFNTANVHTSLTFAGLAGGGAGSPLRLSPGNHTFNIYFQAPAGTFTTDANDYGSMLFWELP